MPDVEYTKRKIVHVDMEYDGKMILWFGSDFVYFPIILHSQSDLIAFRKAFIGQTYIVETQVIALS